MTELDYPSVSSALQRVGTEMDPAECHGQLCGLLCSLPDLTYARWLEMALPELVERAGSGDALAAETDKILRQLFADTVSGIQDPELGFQLFIPGEQENLLNRLEIMAEWCSGFLLGLSMGGVKEFTGLPGDIPEFLQDMVEISRAGSFELDNEEEDERSFMELIEYVRMGVMLVRMEFQHLHSDKNDGQLSIH